MVCGWMWVCEFVFAIGYEFVEFVEGAEVVLELDWLCACG